MKKVLLLSLGLIVTIFFMACVNKDDEEDEKSSSEFSVVFDANGGTMSNADKNSTSQKTYVVKPNGTFRLPSAEDLELSKNGCSFKGWAKSETSTEVDFYATREIRIQANEKYYAVWLSENTHNYYISSKGSDSFGDGSEGKPYATLSTAVKNLSASDDDYVFYISGTVNDSVELLDTTTKEVGARTITILGLNENSTDSLVAKGNSSILSIRTSVPVYVKNLSLSGGNGIQIANGTQGGAVYISFNSSEEDTEGVIFDSVVFRGNSASYGGAIYNGKGKLTLTKCKFIENISSKTGGAIYSESETSLNIKDCEFIKNTSSENAGAIYNKGSLSFESSEISDNKSTTRGGGIYNTGNFVLKSGTVQNNFSDDAGGAIYNSGTFTINSGTFTKNSASIYAGAFYNEGSLNIYGGNIIENSVSGENSYGAAIYNNKKLFIGAVNAVIKNHTATFGAGVYNDENGDFDFRTGKISENNSKIGGGIYNKGTMNLSGGIVEKNSANENGGGIFNSSSLNIIYGEIANNKAEINGGGIANVGENAVCTFTCGKINANKAVLGGGIYNEFATITMKEGKFENQEHLYGIIDDNMAFINGGGIYLKAGSLAVTKGLITAYGTHEVGKDGKGVPIYSDYGNSVGENGMGKAVFNLMDVSSEMAVVNIGGKTETCVSFDSDVAIGVK